MLTHVARNAESHTRMFEAAARGEVDDQYPGGPEQRAADIEDGADRPARELLADVSATCAALEAAWQHIDDATWARGRGRVTDGARPIAELPYRRWREVEIHHTDAGVGLTPADWTDEFVGRELTAMVATATGSVPGVRKITTLPAATTTSNRSPMSSVGSARSAWTHRRSGALARARSSMAGSRSTPVTAMPRRASSTATRPVPHPASSTVAGASDATRSASPWTW